MEVISLYEMEVSPIEILHLMKANIYQYYEEESILKIAKSYTLKRKALISLIHKISNKMGFKSQTFFQAVNYLDIIFSQNIDIFYDYNLLAVACLIIAYKYCENLPLRPIFKYFVNLYNNEMKGETNEITKDDLFQYEIIICKRLNYKLNYYTIYDFNFFFFGNGIIKIEQLKEINYDDNNLITSELNNSSSNTKSSSNIKKILIKIYERRRHYLDKIIENLICLKYSSLLISICIMEKSIDYVLINEFNLKNSDNSIDIDEIRFNNKKYFRQVMKEFYKIDFEKLPEYQYLKIECENYKLFDGVYGKSNKNSNIIENDYLANSNQFDNNIIFLENNSSKNIKNVNIKNNNLKNNHSPNFNYRNNETKENIRFLYKKVNIPVFGQNNIKKFLKRQHSSSNKNLNINRNTNCNESTKILATIDNFYQKNYGNWRNSTYNVNDNDYYLKKCNTSSSPFNKSPKNKLRSTYNKEKILSKIKNIKRFEGSEEETSTNSKKKYLKNKNKTNFRRPYIKKIVQNYEKNPEEKNKIKENSNKKINLNVKNKVLNGGINNKDKTQNTKKIIISKNINKNYHSMIRGKSVVHKSKPKNSNKLNKDYNFESSPFYERNSSNNKYQCNIISYKLNKNPCLINENNISLNNSNFFYLKENDTIENNAYKIKSIYNRYNSNLTSRNSYQYKRPNSKLANSFIKIKIPHLNNDSIENKNSMSIIDYNNIDNNNYKKNNNYNCHVLNGIKYNNSISLKNSSLTKSNNKSNQSNCIESYNNKNKKSNKYNNYENKDFNDEENIENDKKLLKINNGIKDIKQNNISYINLLDYSTGASNEKNVY